MVLAVMPTLGEHHPVNRAKFERICAGITDGVKEVTDEERNDGRPGTKRGSTTLQEKNEASRRIGEESRPQ